jgi:hypothetical protein
MKRTLLSTVPGTQEATMTPTASASSLIDSKITEAKLSADSIGSLIATQEVNPVPATVPLIKTHWWTADNAMTISASVLVFGLAVMLLSARALIRGIPASAVLRLFGMLTIIVMSVFLIVAGYNTEQVAPVVGLLGTLAGYLVGRSASSDAADRARTAPATTPTSPNGPLLPQMKPGA